MCSAPQQPTPVQPAPAPAPAAPPPIESAVGLSRQQENLTKTGSIQAPSTRADRSLGTPGSGSGLNM